MNPISEKEKEILAFWDKNKIFEKSVKFRPKSKQYVFYDGPPFATGTPHYGHILGLTSKDLFPRYWTMKGYHVERRWGWDCHGLPIENIAEKELKIKEKKEIEKMGIDKFNEFCRKCVLNFAAEWKKTVDRMGKWIEFDNSYKTMDNRYMETVWWIFKNLYDEGYVYEGKKVLLFCPRCETTLSNAETAMDNSYRNITERTATVKFELKDEPKTYFLSWTTTPWTLIGNVALAINPKTAYVKIKVGDEHLILAKDALNAIKEDYKIIKEFKGKDLIGKKYNCLYHIPSDKEGHYVINGGDEVTSEDGTGIVHMALYGEFDYEMIKKYDLPIIQHIGTHGKVILGPREWINQWFKHADELVLEDLKSKNLLYDDKSYTHSYPFCYRCETPLFYNAVNSWFVDIQKIKQKLIKRNERIRWYPDNLKHGRFLHTLKTAPDWSLSRNRFWATSIPVWKCASCSQVKVMGSIKELQKNATKKVPDDLDLHKHIVDKIELKCDKCRSTMKRIPEVFDCWLESGSMPYASKHYPFENKEWFKDNFPADFISEYIAQARTWFYYMHVIGVLLFDKAPFKNIVVSGTILAEDGSKMSKSKKNFPDPSRIFEDYGADSLRFYLMQSQLMKAQDLNFNEGELKDIHRKFTMLLGNIKSFYEISKYNKVKLNDTSSKNIMDRWIISKTNCLIKSVTSSLDNYDVPAACRELIQFIEELSKWYIRRSRERFNSDDAKDMLYATNTFAYALDNLSRLIAPIAPFIAEDIHFSLKEDNKKLQESVHLEDWPKFNEKLINTKLNEEMSRAKEIASLILQEREKEKIAVRQPLNKVTISSNSGLKKEFLDIVLDEVNIKHADFKKSKETSVKIDPRITKELEQEGFFRELTRKIQALRKKANLVKSDEISLVVESDYDMSKFEEELKEKVGAVNISFGALDGKYQIISEEKIKEKTFRIAFNRL